MRLVVRDRLPLFGALGVALILHLLLFTPLFRGPDATSYNLFIRDGQDWHYWLDTNAFQGNFFPMGYPSVVAIFVKLGGGSTLLYQVLSIAMALCVIGFGWTLTRACGRRVQVAVACVLSVTPALLWMGQNHGYEMLLSFLLVASLTLAIRVRDSVGWWGHRPNLAAGAAGLLMGLALLTQSKSAAVLILLLVLLSRRRASFALTALLMSLVLPAFWGLRNLIVQGTAWPFSTNGEMGIWLGNNPFTQTGGVVASMPPKPPGFPTLWQASVNFILSQPEAWFTLFSRRIARLLEPVYLYRESWNLPVENVVLHYFAIAFAVVTVLLFASFVFGRLWANPPVLPPVGWLAALAVVFFLVHLPFQSEARYMAPVVPMMVMVAVPTAIWLTRRARRSLRRGDRATALWHRQGVEL